MLLALAIGNLVSLRFGLLARGAVWVALSSLILLALLMMKQSFTVWVITEERVADVFTSRRWDHATKVARILDEARTAPAPEGRA